MTKILLVEDDKSLREIYGVRLLAEGYDIITAGDGEEALAMAIKDRPSLIVSDVMMPKISGFDMLDILRSTTETRDIRVIMMTALSSEDQRKRGEELGADRYLVKSQVGIEDVVRAVHEVLADVPGAAAAAPAAPASAQPAPSAPVVATPTQAPSLESTPTSSSLPEPTAPFSTPRNSSMNRVITPPSEAAAPTSVSDQIAAELGSPVTIPQPTAIPSPAMPVATPAPQPMTVPAAPVVPPVAAPAATPVQAAALPEVPPQTPPPAPMS